ncbi:MAG: VOC family protein [Chloroflexi bacterium]|nr:VOC family protein [Chloroflexota bacterium]
MTYRLQHVSVPRPPGSVERTRGFYGALLGLEEIPAPTTITTVDVIWFKLNESAELHIFEEEPIGDTSIRHFCLVVEDLEAMRRKLRDAGYTPWDEEPIPGRPRFFCRDPNGNIIEFTTIVGDYLGYQDS